ncbi:hypothetical protein JCM9957A_60140 [Kineosporia succinea]
MLSQHVPIKRNEASLRQAKHDRNLAPGNGRPARQASIRADDPEGRAVVTENVTLVFGGCPPGRKARQGPRSWALLS